MKCLLDKPAFLTVALTLVFCTSTMYKAHAQQQIQARDEKTDWAASWIYRDGDQVGNIWSSYRKTVSLASKPESVTAHIAVDSKYWLWINGEMAVREGGLKRGPTREDSYYDEVDLTEFFDAGENTIAVLVWYWGRSGYSHLDSGQGGFLFEADIGGQTVLSDTTWKVARQSAYWWSDPPTPNFRLSEYNISFDARKEIANWMLPEFDDSGWKGALVLSRAPAGVWGRLFRRPIPQWRDYGLKDYENASSIPSISTGDTLDLQLPYNAQVTPYLKVRADEGVKIEMRTDHYDVVSHVSGNVSHTIRSEYITRDGLQEFESPAWMAGHKVRYHIPAGVEIIELKYRETGYDADFTGWFKSSDNTLDRLWIKAQRTNYVTMRDYFMETAGRERKQASADGTIAILSALYSFDERARGLMEKFWWEMAAWRLADGAFLSGVPGNWEIEFAATNLFMLGELGLWEYYLHTGDTETINQLYPAVRGYLLLYPMLSNGLVSERLDVTPTDPTNDKADGYDHLENVDGPLMANALYQLALRGAVEMARATGHIEDIPEWERRMVSIEEAVNRLYWRGGWYASDGHDGPPDDRGNSLAALAGFLDGLETTADSDAELQSDETTRIYEKRMARVLSRERHASPQYELRAIEALFMLGDDEAAIDRMRERYLPMVEDPGSTLWEVWQPDVGSFAHEFGTGTIPLLSGYVAGIKPGAPGFESVLIEPNPGNLSLVDAGVETGKGPVTIRLDIEDVTGDDEPALVLVTSTPAGTPSTVSVPKPPGIMSYVSVADRSVWQDGVGRVVVDGVRFVEETRSHLRFDVDPGEWEFKAFLKPVPARFDKLELVANGSDAVISWSTYREVNNLGFEVQQRLNEEFDVIGFVDGGGSVDEERRYSYDLSNLTPGSHIFRLQAVGSDGTFAFSDEVELNLPIQDELTASEVFPNPLSGQGSMVIASSDQQHIQVSMFNALGQLVGRPSDDIVVPGEQYHIRIDSSKLPAGMYALRIVSGDMILTRRFIVAR